MGGMEGRRLFSLVGREIEEFLEKDPAAVTGYLRRGQDLQVQMERFRF